MYFYVHYRKSPAFIVGRAKGAPVGAGRLMVKLRDNNSLA